MILSAYAKHPVRASFKTWLSRHDVAARLENIPRPGGTNAALWLTPNGGFAHALLFLHGMGNDHLYANLDLFTALVQAGIAVLSVDLDGHGVLSASTLSADGLDQLVPEAWALLRRLADDKILHLAGYSLGAALCLKAADALQPRTLTLASFPLARPAKGRFLATEALTFLHPHFVAAARRHGLLAVWPAFGAFGRSRYPVRLAAMRDEWAYVEEIERYMMGVDPYALASALTVQSIWLGGERDLLCPPAQLQRVSQSAPHGRACAFSGVGHLTTLFHEGLGRAVTEHVKRGT